MKTRQLVLCALFAALTSVSALFKIPIPGTPLMITLQTFVIFLAGLLLEPRYALAAQAVYTALGLAGLPVFMGGGGLQYVLAPSFGFILGFFPFIFLVSWLVRPAVLKLINTKDGRGAAVAKAAGFTLTAHVIMYVFAVIYMYFIYSAYMGENVSIGHLVVSVCGIYFFIDLIKYAAALLLALAVLRRVPAVRTTAKMT